MEFIETELENSPFYENDVSIDSGSAETSYSIDSLILAGPEEENAPAPAIITDIENQNQEVLQVGEPVQESVQADPGQDQAQEPSEGLEKIYNLLSERLPQAESESESESEIQETEDTYLYDISNKLDDIRQFESEQLNQLQQIHDNAVISSNNNYHMDIYQISISAAILGGIAISLLFRKIG